MYADRRHREHSVSPRNGGRSGETLARTSSGKLDGAFLKKSFEKSTICFESSLNASMLDGDPGRFRQREKLPRDNANANANANAPACRRRSKPHRAGTH